MGKACSRCCPVFAFVSSLENEAKLSNASIADIMSSSQCSIHSVLAPRSRSVGAHIENLRTNTQSYIVVYSSQNQYNMVICLSNMNQVCFTDECPTYRAWLSILACDCLSHSLPLLFLPPPVCVCVCLSVCLSVSPSLCLYLISLSFSLSPPLSAHVSLPLFVSLPFPLALPLAILSPSILLILSNYIRH